MKKPKTFKPTRVSGAKKFNAHKQRDDLYKDAKWNRYRFRFLHHNPKCYSCPNPSKHVDHLIPARTDAAGFWREGNHVPLCASCHSFVTAKFDRCDPPKTEEKVKWLQGQRQSFKLNHSIKVIKIEN